MTGLGAAEGTVALVLRLASHSSRNEELVPAEPGAGIGRRAAGAGAALGPNGLAPNAGFGSSFVASRPKISDSTTDFGRPNLAADNCF